MGALHVAWSPNRARRRDPPPRSSPAGSPVTASAGSCRSDDPYHGGEGFRPTLNAYHYGDAVAIAALLRINGGRRGAERYERDARALQANVERHLWDGADQFYKHVLREGDARRPRADRVRPVAPPHGSGERFGRVGAADRPAGFAAPFGPSTVERRSQWFVHDALKGCCRWSDPCWPYATSQALTAMANPLIDYPDQPHVDEQDRYRLPRGYALIRRKDGQPCVAEAHHPDEDRRLYDSRGHSEDCNHSTFNDLVLSVLLDFRP